ncbi:spore germination protein [Clostridium ganghwense]|uniref:Spore germination protein n=1 Tax=Clostridium ganghwense TaxID=312089 RepID=A0ABT4CLS1_9CLOT|nr:spore germination protein [Clostridium ganghwense]MCY6369061.1 spore germination protein [Clostridium ganghwense]
MYSTNLEININELQNRFKNDNSVKFRRFESKNSSIRCCIVFIEGMVKSEIINENIIRPLVSTSINENIHGNELLDYLTNKLLICDEIVKSSDIDTIINSVEYGDTLLIIDGVSEGIILNTKGWQRRNISEPTSESIVKGPKEGFTESIIVNTSLLRRKILNPALKFEYMQLGERTNTKVCISYIEGFASSKILNELKRRLNNIDIDGILDSEYILEYIKDEPFSSFMTVGTTERPDVVAGKLLEGRIAVFCDGTPLALTIPYLFIENFQVNEDYYRHYIFATFNRILRVLCFILSTSTPAVYMALITFHHQMLPTRLYLSIAMAREGVPFPSIIEILIMLIAFEILREAGTRLPKNIGQAISIVGALILGEAAVSARLVSAPIVIITAITGISSFALPVMLEPMLVIRFLLIILSFIFGLYGYIFGVMGIFIVLMSMKSYGIDYMSYVIPKNIEDIEDVAIRMPLWNMNYRPKDVSKNRVRRKIKNKGRK